MKAAPSIDTIWSAFIREARGESLEPSEPYTVEELRKDMDRPRYVEMIWWGNKRVIEAIEQFRGLDAEAQYQRGIVSMPSKIQAMFISHAMRKRFGVLDMDHFKNGEFQVSYHDFLVPVRENGRITTMKAYTIQQMRKWGQRTELTKQTDGVRSGRYPCHESAPRGSKTGTQGRKGV